MAPWAASAPQHTPEAFLPCPRLDFRAFHNLENHGAEKSIVPDHRDVRGWGAQRPPICLI